MEQIIGNCEIVQSSAKTETGDFVPLRGRWEVWAHNEIIFQGTKKECIKHSRKWRDILPR